MIDLPHFDTLDKTCKKPLFKENFDSIFHIQFSRNYSSSPSPVCHLVISEVFDADENMRDGSVGQSYTFICVFDYTEAAAQE